ncbi:3'5'-cyclic nucleotide phosphodiesterase family protein [Trichomonas vaginalis G3]|uniref:Phosphodiesterase n=1 Tax=Trichomonas vaginalis (strain ATCC PRA-98 / G3) TaxID=412133 RepID=A2EPA8_TRIV3|nr:3',5'-cyclic-nucleotide phosphodiesterase protein [Trichomonas vaginalis G3]EAY05493.1 3'5'-cyclic nucleotide phosphodiesterase family protein [Trichomonas vaginalis G3]KAI5507796.1 3',5'-cyclic-nucleotide phosphodiesterase protein [Trichomonas vaginalis G3]|eukprot:XP_001317716.1 3'5'-cyclic nucleotide phosphodiesterase family protein [Trichomonas vaginalis G3]
MISIQHIKDKYREKIDALVQRVTHAFTVAAHAECTIVFKIHPDYENVYVYSTDIDGFIPDNIYPLIPQILPDELHQLKCMKMEKFGNVSGPLYLTSIRVQSPLDNAFVSCISTAEIKSFSNDQIKEIENIISQCKYDFQTVLEHVRTLPVSEIEKCRSYKFSVENINTDTAFESIFSFFYYAINDTDVPIDWNQIIAFIAEAQKHYNSVPYHNWRHATDATQFVYYFVSMEPVSKMLTSLDKFALLLSVICHDLEHNGHTNDYHRKTNSDFAKESGPDLPPLENHHQNLAKVLVRKFLTYTLDHLSESKKDDLFKLITEIIFSTDMSKHKYFVDKINENVGKLDSSLESHILACQAIMKLADLSNTCRLFQDGAKMAKRLTEEWYLQGDDERRLGLPISKGMDRNNPTPLPVDQIGFYKYCTLQLLMADQKYFGCFEDVVAQFNSNLSTWEKLAKEL